MPLDNSLVLVIQWTLATVGMDARLMLHIVENSFSSGHSHKQSEIVKLYCIALNLVFLSMPSTLVPIQMKQIAC
jgi:hypothetical protein